MLPTRSLKYLRCWIRRPACGITTKKKPPLLTTEAESKILYSVEDTI